MPRDYKNSFHQPPKKKWRLELISVVALIVVVLGGVFWTYSHKETASFSREGFAAWMAEIKTKWSQRNSNAAKSKPLTLAQKEAQHNEVHFDFYNELPKMQVGVPEIAKATAALTPAPAAPAPAKTAGLPAAPAPQYIVQIATFHGLAEASQLRISLLLAGVEAEIAKTPVDGQTIYSVQQGPYASEALAKTSQRKLQQKGFTSVMLKTANQPSY